MCHLLLYAKSDRWRDGCCGVLQRCNLFSEGCLQKCNHCKLTRGPVAPVSKERKGPNLELVLESFLNKGIEGDAEEIQLEVKAKLFIIRF